MPSSARTARARPSFIKIFIFLFGFLFCLFSVLLNCHDSRAGWAKAELQGADARAAVPAFLFC